MNYSISDLERLSGVSVHNIRIWERRYGALTPSRTSGNVRFYDDGQLKKLLNIVGLQHAGFKISKACGLSHEDTSKLLQDEINHTVPTDQRYAYYISQIINSALVFNEQSVSDLISVSFRQNGVLETYKYVIYPMLVRVGLMWLNESLCPAQEHFLSSIIRQKIFAAIDNAGFVPNDKKPQWLLFLPEDEDHDIGLLLASFLLRAGGCRVTYLGAKVPLPALKNTVDSIQPGAMLFFMTRVRPVADAQAYINQLASEMSDTKIFLSGNTKVMSNVHCPGNVSWLETLQDFEHVITRGE